MRIVSGILEGARVVPTPNRGGDISPHLIVMHDTASRLTKGSAVQWLTNPKARASAHFVIERDGTIAQLLACHLKAWHAGQSSWNGIPGVNNFSIGIELVNPGKMQLARYGIAQTWFGQQFAARKYSIQEATTPHHGHGYWMPYTKEQIAAALRLITALRDKYDIPNITTHWEISPGRKVDTNPLFPLDYFRARFVGRERTARDVLQVPGGLVHKWPSWVLSNTKRVIPDVFFPILRSGTFLPTGESIPDDVSGKQLWYCIETDGGAWWVHHADAKL